MITMAVYYRQTDDAETFEKRYIEEHLPLIDQYENIAYRSFGKVARTLVGEAPFTHVFVGQWADKDGFKADLGSPKAAEATENAKELAPSGFDVVLLEWLDAKESS